MQRYFKDDEDPETCGTSYFEFDGEYNTRKVELRNGHWSYASENYRQDDLADQPLSNCDPEMWDHEITQEEFEVAWRVVQEFIR